MAAVPPSPPTDAVRRRMHNQKTAGTAVEMAVRRALHARGYRYRVNYKLLPGYPFRADIVWTSRKIAVFLDGCFWHYCPLHGSIPVNNSEWWRDKLVNNQRRDRRVDATLEECGWRVMRFWEHENVQDIVDEIGTSLPRMPK